MADYLLDTDVSIEIINHPMKWDNALFGLDLAISSVTAYELGVGIEKCRSPKTVQETRGFLAAIEVIEFDLEAALESGRVSAELEVRGAGIGPYDTLIAGHSRAQECILITNNLREFKRVNGLTVKSLHDMRR